MLPMGINSSLTLCCEQHNFVCGGHKSPDEPGVARTRILIYTLTTRTSHWPFILILIAAEPILPGVRRHKGRWRQRWTAELGATIRLEIQLDFLRSEFVEKMVLFRHRMGQLFQKEAELEPPHLLSAPPPLERDRLVASQAIHLVA
jgi:hypothetical protein